MGPARVSFEEFKKLKAKNSQLVKDRDIWKNKFYFVNGECSKLCSQLQEKEDVIKEKLLHTERLLGQALEEITALKAELKTRPMERQAALIDTLMARLKLIPLTPLSITVFAPVVSDTTIPATIPITTVVTAAATTGFSISSGFAYPFGYPYGPPHGYQGFIPPPELTKGFPTGPFGPYGPYGSHPLESPPLVSQPLTLKPIVSQVFVPQYYGANPYGAQLFVSMGNPGYTISPAAVVTYHLQEDLTNLYHGPSIHSDAAEDVVQVNMITEDENLIMDVLKVKTSLVPVHLKLFKVGILKKYHEKCSVCLRNSKGCFYVQKDIQMLISEVVLQVSGNKKNDEVSFIIPIFNKPKAFEIFCPPIESTPPADSAKRLDIKMPAPFPYKFDKDVPWGYKPTITVNGVEKPLVNNKVITNIADASGITRSGMVFTPSNLRGGKHVVVKPDNGKAPSVIPESRPI
ncbi:hypothetical protein KIW84_013683 [Lathyrus oleraceus]|uniref:Uncharacterized protein n=1 Tax=Pisum sativum TaxID=3888 RepID=A0A9D5BLB0_PEA|nr:hypothetical protein KIW84_013683 [Pisum sativum]